MTVNSANTELPRLKASTMKRNNKSQRTYKPRNAGNSAKDSAKDAPDDETLAKEEEILSLLTTLNEPIINDDLPATLQAIKGALFLRDYATAFGRPVCFSYHSTRASTDLTMRTKEYLRAYCARWVPGRALAYRDLLGSSDAMAALAQRRSLRQHPFNVMCVGGGAGSELLALASVAKDLELETAINVTAVDSADWTVIVDEMRSSIKEDWELDEETFKLSFAHDDILESFAKHDFASINLITSLFTTNELFSASRPKTLAFLSHLSDTCQSGTLLMIAESAGSYSEISVGDKKYPLDLVLDQHLAGKGKAWRVVDKEQSRWYRISEETKAHYRLQMENTHMLVRVYEKI
jgi:25S rRNA (uracil2843-N3)-methyltransferase